MTRTTLALGLALPFALFVAGCKQDQGGRCEIDSDCSGGLVCLKSVDLNGVCMSKDAPVTRADAAAAADRAPAVDVAPVVDVVPVDVAPDAVHDATSGDLAAD